MAAASYLSAFPTLQFHIRPNKKSPSKLSNPGFSNPPIYASISETKPSTVTPSKSGKLPLLPVPGSYGLPVIGPINDRIDYFYNQGRDEFFKSRVQKYQSTVYRVNMPPGPFIASDPHVVVLLDGKSFPVLFDVTKVEKKDLFTGTYMPSTDLTGGYRILSYLDPSEPNHAKLKSIIFSLLKSRRDHVIPEFHSSFTELFETLEKNLEDKGKAGYNDPNDQASFNFARAFFGANPPDTKLGLDGPKLIGKWVLFQLSPILTLGLPKVVEEPTIHSYRLPPFLVKSDCKRLYDFFYASAGSILSDAENLGISREEACHNILFAICFNSFGGLKILFPSMMKWIGSAGVKLHTQLAQEIRSAIKSSGGEVTMAAMEQMPLMKSVVYEALRIEPPVPTQYGKAKKDLIIESHDAAFEIKEGEMLFGYQPFATKDPKIFDRAEEFVADRFVGDGEKLLKHVLWSNGHETENPSVSNKQCAGKDFIVLASRLLVVELFRRYDSFEIEVGKSALGVAVTVTSLTRASF
ncbi:Allene oxide synthase [Tripterygium wilfordii]|uniref:Allene oxide synthase n=1 Tax=Tripterygium wilfordii TaxID=458696 RepID=A0A7J7CZA5_TRIWF|nr:allene oxide synthase 1, chloroplastic-like [Tripterygium wilfordii]KAF5739417.1 Allene oxide synthase [Tripterygium wilfordii]